MTKALVVTPLPALARTAPRSNRGAAALDAVTALLENAATGRVSPRQARRLQTVLTSAKGIAATIFDIVEDGDRMAAEAAECGRRIAQCDAGIAAFRAAEAQSAAARTEAEERATHLPKVVEQEMRLRKLTAQVQAEELATRLAALKAARPAKTKPATSNDTTPKPSASTRPSPEDALLARLSSEAAAVLREVQAGSVPTDARHPFHAFAGSVYLRARLDGDDARTASTRAQDALVAHMRESHEFTASERKAFRRAYDDLKKELDGTSEARQGERFLSMLGRVGAASAPSNGRGVQ
jgi:hypothetical protein